MTCAPVIPLPAIHKNWLYPILACVAKNGTCARIIPNLFGQNRPKQEQLHVFSCILTPTWFWLVRLLYQCRLDTRTAYTWFWLVWPKTGLLHELLQHFVATVGSKQDRPHAFSCIFTPTWFWLVRLLYQCRLYTRTAYTWFWLVWPKTGLVHKLFQNFLAAVDRNKNSYMYFLAFSLQHDSGLRVCFLPVPAISKDCLYLILACVAKNGTCAWII